MASQPRSSYGEGDLCLNPTVPAHNPGADSNSSHANGHTSAVARARRRGGKNLSLPEPPQPQGFTCFACRVAKGMLYVLISASLSAEEKTAWSVEVGHDRFPGCGTEVDLGEVLMTRRGGAQAV